MLARARNRLRAAVATPPPHAARFLEPVDSSPTHNDNGPLRRFLAGLAAGARLLDLGSGDRRIHPAAVNLDIVPSAHVDVVGDGHRLPFQDGTFDAVVLQTVIEHVLEPERVVAETARVLAPGGRAYIEAPFLYPVHGGADYYRWTREGLRYMVGKHLDVEEIDYTMGPASTLSLTWRGFLDARYGGAHWSLRNAAAWATAWVPRLDRMPVSTTASVYATCYVYGRRR